MKILKHKIKEKHFRILMRGEQVLKLSTNHRISILDELSTAIKFEPVNYNKFTYYVQDCSEGEPYANSFLVQFFIEKDFIRFKVEFEKVQKMLLEKSDGVEIIK